GPAVHGRSLLTKPRTHHCTDGNRHIDGRHAGLHARATVPGWYSTRNAAAQTQNPTNFCTRTLHRGSWHSMCHLPMAISCGMAFVGAYPCAIVQLALEKPPCFACPWRLSTLALCLYRRISGTGASLCFTGMATRKPAG